MQTSPCNEHPLTPHFYIVKLGCTGVYIFFLFLVTEAVLTCTHNLCFEQKQEKNQKISSKNYHFYSCEILQNIARTCLRNVNVSKADVHVIHRMVLLGGWSLQREVNIRPSKK